MSGSSGCRRIDHVSHRDGITAIFAPRAGPGHKRLCGPAALEIAALELAPLDPDASDQDAASGRRLAADRPGVGRKRQPVEPDGARIAPDQVETPPPALVAPVVGELDTADGVVDAPETA